MPSSSGGHPGEAPQSFKDQNTGTPIVGTDDKKLQPIYGAILIAV